MFTGRQVDGGDLAGIRCFASKLAGAVARIAGGFHLIENVAISNPWRMPVDQTTVLAAWAIGEYLIEHALAAFGQMGTDSSQALAQRILSWALRNNLDCFSKRDCHQAHRSTSLADVDHALEILIERGYIRPLVDDSTKQQGRPKSPLYSVNPLSCVTR